MVEIDPENNKCEMRRFRGPLAEDSAQYHSPRFGIKFKKQQNKACSLFYPESSARSAIRNIFQVCRHLYLPAIA